MHTCGTVCYTILTPASPSALEGLRTSHMVSRLAKMIAMMRLRLASLYGSMNGIWLPHWQS
eukprot:6470411-Amphidinium_carterae.3